MQMSFARIARRSLCFSSLAAVLAAQSLTGVVTDPSGAGIPLVSVQLSSGASTTTSATGAFTFTLLQNRSYTVSVLPPTSQWAPRQVTTTVAGATNLGNVIVQPGAALTGTVVGPTGLPVVGANMDAIDATGIGLFTPNDGTNALGQFAITVPLGTLNLRTIAPVGSQMIGTEQTVAVIGPTNVGTIPLRQGFVTIGTVVNGVSSVPLANVRITTFDGLTDAEIGQATPLTNAFGQFSVLLPVGVFRFEVLPAAGSSFAAKEVHGIIVVAPDSVGTIRLSPAVFLTGSVLGPAGAVANADIDVLTLDGHKIFTNNDNTSATGTFNVAVPAGSYRVLVEPLAAAGLVGTRTGVITVAASTNIGVISLSPGVPLSISVSGPNGPEIDADLDLVDPITGESLVLAGDHADANGVINAIVPIGVWNAALDARQGSLAAPLNLSGAPILGSLGVAIQLPQKDVRLQVQGLGILARSPGSFLPLNVTVHNTTAASVSTLFEIVIRFPSGAEQPLFPPVPVELPPLFDLTLSAVYFPVPAVPASEFERELRMIVRTRSAATNAVLDQAYAAFVVR